MARNPVWSREELILALDLYFRHNPSHISHNHPAVLELSGILSRLPIHDDRPDQVRFRNPNGVYMKMCNFLRLDPSYPGVGLSRGGKMEEVIWNEFASNRDHLSKVAAEIRSAVLTDVLNSDSDGELFPEGSLKIRLHRTRERNRSAVERKKRQATERGALRCEACGFSFEEFYGDIGKGIIECHHNQPLSEVEEGHETRLQDLALVCANCHRVIHSTKTWLPVAELRERAFAEDTGGK